jgi:hypothetical protein
VIRLIVHDSGVLFLQDERGDAIWSTGALPPARPLAKPAVPLTPGRKGTPTRPAAAGVPKSRAVPAGRAVRRSDGEQSPSEG